MRVDDDGVAAGYEMAGDESVEDAVVMRRDPKSMLRCHGVTAFGLYALRANAFTDYRPFGSITRPRRRYRSPGSSGISQARSYCARLASQGFRDAAAGAARGGSFRPTELLLRNSSTADNWAATHTGGAGGWQGAIWAISSSSLGFGQEWMPGSHGET